MKRFMENEAIESAAQSTRGLLNYPHGKSQQHMREKSTERLQPQQFQTMEPNGDLNNDLKRVVDYEESALYVAEMLNSCYE